MRSNWLIGLVGAVAVVLCVAPVVMGFVIERVYDELVVEASRQAGRNFVVTGAFHRGLWTSSATTTVDRLGETTSPPTALKHEWVHGPIPLGELLRGRSPVAWLFAVLETTYSPEPGTVPTLARTSADPALVEVETRVHFDRSLALAFEVSGFDMPQAGLSFAGLWGEAVLGTGRAEFSGRVTLGRTVLGADASVVVDGATLSGLRAPVDDGLETYQLTLNLGEIEWMGQNFGPGGISASAQRVDLTAARELNERLSALDDSVVSEEERMIARATAIGDELPRVLRGSPRVEISRMELATPNGEIMGRAQIGVDGSDPTMLANPLFLMGLVQAHAELAVPEDILAFVLDRYMVLNVAATEEAQGLSEADLLEMAAFMREGMLGGLLAQKRIVLDEGHYRIDANFDAGLLILNGEMLDPTELSELFSGL